MKRIAIVGGGISGLTAAWQLATRRLTWAANARILTALLEESLRPPGDRAAAGSALTYGSERQRSSG